MISKAKIAATAEDRGFEVLTYTQGPGACVHVQVKDKTTETLATIGVWPDTSEANLVYLFAVVAHELRGGGYQQAQPHSWMM